MHFIVELVRDSVETGGRDRFSLSNAAWDLMQEVGKTFGWKPAGTAYLRSQGANDPESTALHDYQPGTYRDYKVVTADDARAWAMALSEAQKSEHLDKLIGQRPGDIVLADAASTEQTQSLNAPFPVTLAEFIEYAFGGGFSFARAV